MTDFFRRTGLLPGTAFVVASNAPTATIRQARILKARYGDLVQICDGTADDVQIQAAIDALPAGGGRVVLSEGTFNTTAEINVPANVTLEGQGWTTIISGSGVAITSAVIQVAGDRVHIKNLKVVVAAGAGTVAARPNAIRVFNLSYVRIERVWAIGDTSVAALANDNYQNGILINGLGYNEVKNCLVQNGIHRGIFLKGGVQPSGGHNLVAGNIVTNWSYSGICIDAHDYTSVVNNISNDNPTANGHGIYVFDAEKIAVTGNVCEGNAGYGIYLMGGANYCTVAGNTCEGNIYGIDIQDSTYNEVSGNTCKGNGSGIYVTTSAHYNSITGNNVSGNNNNGIALVSTVKGCQVTGNTCISNSNNGIYLYLRVTETLVGNNNVSYNTRDGIQIYDECSNNEITGNLVVDNDYANSGNYYGIRIVDQCDKNYIHGNKCYVTNAAQRQNWGIAVLVAAPKPDSNVIENNDLRQGGKTAPLTDGGTNTVIRNNPGYTASGDTVTISKAIDHADIVDGGGATGYVDFADAIPAGSIIKAIKFDYTEAFNSDNTTTLTIMIGPQADLDAFNKTADPGEDGFNTTTDAFWGESDCQEPVVTAAATPRVTFTEDNDITHIISGAGAQGAITITITYMKA